ncbi:wHTH domain-containing protein [Streptomyces sp. enrichment culture]|uniref:wHTH domain-containing protein n=1 Tax=Streptomyces sp. enrichment culture TaxID=1795815 RepID=UPI003F577AC7
MRERTTRNVAGEVTGPVVQAERIGQVNIHHAPPLGPAPHADEDPWVARVEDSAVWRHVPETREVAKYREAAGAVAAALAGLRDEAETRLADDPWRDPHAPERFAERLEWLLGEPGEGAGLDLYPAEAALFTLVPLLARVHDLRLAAGRLHVEPWRPGPDPLGTAPPGTAPGVPSPERAAFEAYAEGNGVLVQRASLRPDAAAPLGWWLYHRWLVRHEAYAAPETVRELLDAVGEAGGGALGRVLTARRVSRLLHGLRRGPDVCNPEFLDALAADETVGVQRVRYRRLVLLCALAYALSPGTTSLPDVVAEHVGIPHAVDLDALRTTLEECEWGGTPELPVLRAACSHEAVVEGLREAVGRMDEVLHAVTRTARERVAQPMPRLPVRLSADGVAPVEGAFTGWARFRLDERRVRDLLMGVQLYKDRDLAVRELYQNALDACRYRRARTEYLDRTHPAATYTYEGSIVFEQGVDEDGRAYVDCRDDGIGMGEAELRGVFAHAGARFAEQPDFREERAEWARLDPPVELYPNSRFGIGVLSYFMLADELRVTTCRMGHDGMPGPVLEASVFGPGHLFRIVRSAPRGTAPGTTVRLYLRGVEPDWSCPEVLGRLLGVAEFPTVARRGTEVVRWKPGVLRERRSYGDDFGLDVDGAMEAWPDAPPGAQVFWCRRGGGLLADGLVVRPDTRGGVLARQGRAGLFGAVVNLSGPLAPERLSADRTLVLDDVRDTVRDLLAEAAGHLLDGPVLDVRWLVQVASRSRALADLVVERCLAEDWDVPGRPPAAAATGRAGFLPDDLPFLFPDEAQRDGLEARQGGLATAPDHIVLWRVLAHGVRHPLEELVRLCPELAAVGPVAPALPSDAVLVQGHFRATLPRGMVFETAADLYRSPLAVARRAAELGLYGGPEDAFPDRPAPEAHPSRPPQAARRLAEVTPGLLVRACLDDAEPLDRVVSRFRAMGVKVPDDVLSVAAAGLADEVLLPYLRERRCPWFVPGENVPPLALVDLALGLGRPVPEVCARLRACGLGADGSVLPDTPTEGLARALSERTQGAPRPLDPEAPVPPGHVLLAARELGVDPAEAVDWYRRLGFTAPEPFPAETESHDLDILTPLVDSRLSHRSPLRPGRPVFFGQLLAVARRGKLAPALVASRMRAYGLSVPALRPTAPSRLDDLLLAEDGLMDWHELRADAPVPYARVIVAAATLLVPPTDVAARLVEHGFPLSCPGLPEGLSHGRAVELVRKTVSPSTGDPAGLYGLLQCARALDTSLTQVHRWLVALGVHVVDPAEAVRAALPLIPRARTPDQQG